MCKNVYEAMLIKIAELRNMLIKECVTISPSGRLTTKAKILFEGNQNDICFLEEAYAVFTYFVSTDLKYTDSEKEMLALILGNAFDPSTLTFENINFVHSFLNPADFADSPYCLMEMIRRDNKKSIFSSKPLLCKQLYQFYLLSFIVISCSDGKQDIEEKEFSNAFLTKMAETIRNNCKFAVDLSDTGIHR